MKINQLLTPISSAATIRTNNVSEQPRELQCQQDKGYKIAESQISQMNYSGGTEKKSNIDAEEKIIKAIEEANKKLVNVDTTLEFSIHERTKQIMVKVIDKGTEEIIKEIPSEKVLNMIADMYEAAGLMIDEKI